MGKSTIFNALTAAAAPAENFPFCTVNPNVGIVKVPDPRLNGIAALVPHQDLVPATMTFVDIAGLVKGANKGEGLGNQFLGHIRETQAVAHVVRCFSDPNVAHVSGDVDPVRDAGVVETELELADLDTVTRKYATVEKTARAGNKEAAAQFAVLSRVRAALEAGQPVRSLGLAENELARIQEYNVITAKKVMYVANVDDTDGVDPSANPFVRRLMEMAAVERAPVVPICGKIEAEIAELPEDEKAKFLKDFGMEEPGLNRLIRAGYELLGLHTFFTATGGREIRAWTCPKGIKAGRAAGLIHTDMERGFVKAEVYGYDDLMRLKTEQAVRDAGAMRLEGREYVVRDGDVIRFRFSV